MKTNLSVLLRCNLMGHMQNVILKQDTSNSKTVSTYVCQYCILEDNEYIILNNFFLLRVFCIYFCAVHIFLCINSLLQGQKNHTDKISQQQS